MGSLISACRVGGVRGTQYNSGDLRWFNRKDLRNRLVKVDTYHVGGVDSAHPEPTMST